MHVQAFGIPKKFPGEKPPDPHFAGVGGEEKIVPLHRRLVPPLAEIPGYGPDYDHDNTELGIEWNDVVELCAEN